MTCKCYGAAYPIPVTTNVGGIQIPGMMKGPGIPIPKEGYIEQRSYYGAMPIPTTGTSGGIVVPGMGTEGGIQVPSEGYVKQTYGALMDLFRKQIPLPIVGVLSVGTIIIGAAVIFLAVKYAKKE